MKFFKVLDTKEAKKIVKDNIEAAALKVTSRKTSDAVGYTVSDDVFSTEKYPPYNRSTVDGYAVFSGDVACASSSVPSVMKITGRVPSLQQAIIIFSSFVQPFMIEPP